MELTKLEDLEVSPVTISIVTKKRVSNGLAFTVKAKSYLVISSVAFSPSFMVVTPSSQPVVIY